MNSSAVIVGEEFSLFHRVGGFNESHQYNYLKHLDNFIPFYNKKYIAMDGGKILWPNS